MHYIYTSGGANANVVHLRPAQQNACIFLQCAYNTQHSNNAMHYKKAHYYAH